MDANERSGRDHALARRANNWGAQYSLRIVIEARRAEIPASLAFALIETESGFRNVFGHDPTIFAGAGQVTRAKYEAYLAKRGPRGEGGMQGIGPAQLTWWTYQDEADRLGGCWKTQFSIRVGLSLLGSLTRRHGLVAGVAAYNGSGHAAVDYSRLVRARASIWAGRLS